MMRLKHLLLYATCFTTFGLVTTSVITVQANSQSVLPTKNLAEQPARDETEMSNVFLDLRLNGSRLIPVMTQYPTAQLAQTSYQDIFKKFESEQFPTEGLVDYINILNLFFNGEMTKAELIEYCPKIAEKGGFDDDTLNEVRPRFEGIRVDELQFNPQAEEVRDLSANPEELVFDIPMETNDSTLTINYEVPKGYQQPASRVVTGSSELTAPWAYVRNPKIAGLAPENDWVKSQFEGTDKTVTVVYTEIEKPEPPTPPTGGGNNSGGSNNNVADSQPEANNESPVTETPNSQQPTPTMSDQLIENQAAKSFKIYLTKGLYTYQKPDFKQSQRVKYYPQRSRTKAQTLTVVKTVKNSTGKARYQLSNGTYITANQNYTQKLYYSMAPKRVKVINRTGIRQYPTTQFKDRQAGKRLKRGQVLKVKRIVHTGLSSKFQLTNGHYITANKQFVKINQ